MTRKSRAKKKPKQSKRKSILDNWQSKFAKVLKTFHGHMWKNVFHRLMKKSSTLRSSLRKRSKEYEVEFDISLKEIRVMLLKAYGKKCKYCSSKMTIKNTVCDHVTPLSLGGKSNLRNLQLICARCNTRKGTLTDRQYGKVLSWLKRQPEIVEKYILRKLAKSDRY